MGVDIACGDSDRLRGRACDELRFGGVKHAPVGGLDFEKEAESILGDVEGVNVEDIRPFLGTGIRDRERLGEMLFLLLLKETSKSNLPTLTLNVAEAKHSDRSSSSV